MTEVTLGRFLLRHIREAYEIAERNWGEKIAGSMGDELVDSLNPDSTFDHQYITAKVEGKVVGFSGYRRSLMMSNAWEFTWLNVHPDYQGRKIGTKLVEERIRLVEEAGGSIILLMTKAHMFYGRWFEINGRFDDYWLMTKKLGEVKIV